MKKLLIIITCALFACQAMVQDLEKQYEYEAWTGITINNNVLNNPESVVYDKSNGRYFVSNWEDGNIIIIDHLQQQLIFNDVLQHVAGLHICNGILYACSYQGPYPGVVGFDMITSGIVFHKYIPGMSLPNGITSDGSDYLYVTGYFANKIYKIKICDSTHTVLLGSGLSLPNGIEFDHINDRLLVMNEGDPAAPIISVDKDNGEISTLVETNIGQTDGLAIDTNGNTYFSSWATGKVYKYDPSFSNPPEVFSSGHSGPADIYADNYNQLLAIPNFNSNTVDFIPFNNIISVPGKQPGTEAGIDIEAFPNPFSESINITVKGCGHEVPALLEITDISGKQLKHFHLHGKNPEILWDGKMDNGQAAKAGPYLLRVVSGKHSCTAKILKTR